jgi:hypothetical protein
MPALRMGYSIFNRSQSLVCRTGFDMVIFSLFTI